MKRNFNFKKIFSVAVATATTFSFAIPVSSANAVAIAGVEFNTDKMMNVTSYFSNNVTSSGFDYWDGDKDYFYDVYDTSYAYLYESDKMVNTGDSQCALANADEEIKNYASNCDFENTDNVYYISDVSSEAEVSNTLKENISNGNVSKAYAINISYYSIGYVNNKYLITLDEGVELTDELKEQMLAVMPDVEGETVKDVMTGETGEISYVFKEEEGYDCVLDGGVKAGTADAISMVFSAADDLNEIEGVSAIVSSIVEESVNSSVGLTELLADSEVETTEPTTQETTEPTTKLNADILTDTPSAVTLNGDANGDNILDSKDAVIILKDYAEALANNSKTKLNLDVCDVNKDGIVDSKDAVSVLQTYAGNLAKNN